LYKNDLKIGISCGTMQFKNFKIITIIIGCLVSVMSQNAAQEAVPWHARCAIVFGCMTLEKHQDKVTKKREEKRKKILAERQAQVNAEMHDALGLRHRYDWGNTVLFSSDLRNALARGANPNAIYSDRRALPLLWASHHKSLASVHMLIKAGATVNSELCSLHNAIPWRPHKSEWAYHREYDCQCYKCTLETELKIFGAFVEAGADLNFQDTKRDSVRGAISGDTVLISVIKGCRPELRPQIVRYLIADGADEKIFNYEGKNALMVVQEEADVVYEPADDRDILGPYYPRLGWPNAQTCREEMEAAQRTLQVFYEALKIREEPKLPEKTAKFLENGPLALLPLISIVAQYFDVDPVGSVQQRAWDRRVAGTRLQEERLRATLANLR